MDFQTQTKTPFPQYIKPYPRTHFYWSLFLAIVMAIAAGLLIAVENYKTQVEIDTMAVSEIGFNAPRMNSVSINKSENWKIYQNQEYGFEFKYPANLYEIKMEDSLFYIRNTLLPLELGGIAPDGVERKDFVTEGFLFYLDKIKTADLNLRENDSDTVKNVLDYPNIKAVRYDYINQVSRGPVVVISLSSDPNNVLVMGYQALCFKSCNDQLVENYFDQILSSFKFTE